MIYEPAEDSFLLKRVLEKEVQKARSALEIGVGSGYLSEYLDAVSKSFVGVDINPEAVRETKKRVKGNVLQSDLFAKVPKKRYDVIVFNPPYLPKHRADGEEALATVGGKHGYEVIMRFIQELSDFLDPKGSCYLLFSSLSKPQIIFQELDRNLYQYKKVAETSIMMEQLFVYKITPSAVLQKLMREITEIRYLSKGKRSVVLEGQYKRKHVAIKILNDTTDAKNAILNEAKNLKIVNSLGLGPAFLKKGREYVMMEFVAGEQFQKYWLHASKKSIQKALLEILNQCHIMDQHAFQKFEMTRPYKHVIVGEKITLIDFERGKITQEPINVTQFLQFLHSSPFSTSMRERFNISFDTSDVILLAQNYKKSKNCSAAKKYINQMFN